MLKLVIADDEKLIRESISHLIDWSALNIEILAVCKNGLEAFKVISEGEPDLVLTDIKMPGMTGIELASLFSKRAGHPIEFLFLTGYEEFDFALAAIENGVHHYLVKPIDENRLIDAMKQACKSVEQKQRELRNAHVKETAAERIYSECIRQVLHYVELNYQDPDISLKQIAENVLYMNVDYLGRQFKQEYGVRFTQYLTELRISKAMFLLQHTNHNVNEIAEEVGYSNNPKYFSSVFRKEAGMSPHEFRYKRRKKPDED